MSILDKIFGTDDAPRDQPARPDQPMQKVLDELASLGGKPIETLSAQEARLQPTPTDAVKALIRKAGGDPNAPAIGVTRGRGRAALRQRQRVRNEARRFSVQVQSCKIDINVSTKILRFHESKKRRMQPPKLPDKVDVYTCRHVNSPPWITQT